MCWVCDQADKMIAPKTVKYRKLIKFMIGKGGVNAKDCHNRTPLHHAAAFQFPDLVKMLLKKGADPNAKTTPKITPGTKCHIIPETPLDFAINETKPIGKKSRFNNRVIRLLLKYGGKSLRLDALHCPIFGAILYKRRILVKTLLINGNVPKMEPFEILDHLIEGSKLKMARILFKYGGLDVKSPDAEWHLRNTVIHGKHKWVKLFLDFGAEVEKVYVFNGPNGPRETTNLLAAVKLGHLEVVKVLLENGANPNWQADGKISSLEACILRTLMPTKDSDHTLDIEMIQLLLRFGASWKVGCSLQYLLVRKPTSSMVKDTKQIMYLQST